MSLSDFHTRGFVGFPATPASRTWASAARGPALARLDDPAQAAQWRCDHTWFVGVDALPNDAHGRVGDGPVLEGPAVDFIRDALGQPHPASHRAQVSVCLPGYPRQGAEENEAAHRFRARRDAAHVDGVLGEGTPKRRFLRERHDYILGLALEDGDETAAPFVLWEGSHLIMQETFRAALAGVAPQHWGDVDVTVAYQAARARVFDTCRRVVLPLRQGEASVVHRFALHGVAPWGASSLPRRMIAYFRPSQMAPEAWLMGR